MTRKTRDMMILLRPNLEDKGRLPTWFRAERQAHMGLSSSIKTEILTSIFCLYNLIISDTRQAVKGMLDQVSVLVNQNETTSYLLLVEY
jgi:hypothetical protein